MSGNGEAVLNDRQYTYLAMRVDAGDPFLMMADLSRL